MLGRSFIWGQKLCSSSRKLISNPPKLNELTSVYLCACVCRTVIIYTLMWLFVQSNLSESKSYRRQGQEFNQSRVANWKKNDENISITLFIDFALEMNPHKCRFSDELFVNVTPSHWGCIDQELFFKWQKGWMGWLDCGPLWGFDDDHDDTGG